MKYKIKYYSNATQTWVASKDHDGQYTFAEAERRATQSTKDTGLAYRFVEVAPTHVAPLTQDDFIIEVRMKSGWKPSAIYHAIYSREAAEAILRAHKGANKYRIAPLVPPVVKPATPLEKSIVDVFEIQDETVVVIDGDKLEREVLKASIADGDVQKLLPFQTTLVVGENHVHIENASAYTAETNYHSVGYGDTICAKQGQTYAARVSKVATCPGCLAKAKGLIVNHLLNTSGIIR